MPPSDEDWVRDKDRFQADSRTAVTTGPAPKRDHGAPLGPLAQQFATLTYSLLDATTTGDVLQQVADATLHVVPGADLVSVTLRSSDGVFHTPIQTDPVAAELDQLQYELQEGPCLAAADSAGPAVATSDNLATDEAWPRFGPAAAERGLFAVLSTALLPNARPPHLSGALNIYSRRPGGLREADQALALLLATHASLALAHTTEVTQGKLQAEQLLRAIDSRDVIGQAKGILMGRRGLNADEAFTVLRRTSQTLNVKLVELAETLVKHADFDLPELDDPQPR
ncbi:ANTAR domain-containing protein [Actinophytocola algeriensis]|uniref:GAF domain-containing protein n=1 Tax=Actinophytocola algeriensis TaxID=1768010 RepID=A0A7W7Q7P3_9PSEU|nr:ANTAR domain-containing protein [Actinophytocola algeriensis]MBB4908467.1 GAF domain-containing protein [Actinophytocola algeriensis]MBE1475146.1 GAF domain-containing protein [Actinophytocola algeriensis]